MQALIEQLACKHHCNLSEVGTQLWLALPDSNERLLITGLNSRRVGLTHCVADAEDYLVCDTDMVFLIMADDLLPVALLQTEAVWVAYEQGNAGDVQLPVSDEIEAISLPSFA